MQRIGLVVLMTILILISSCHFSAKESDFDSIPNISKEKPETATTLNIELGIPLRFEHLTTDHGLSNANVLDIVQDHDGYMWFATGDGLNRYDGKDFKVFRYDENNPGSISSNFIFDLLIDHEGTLWVATDPGGLNKYDSESESFIHYQHHPEDENSLSNNSVWSLMLDGSGNLWVGTIGGLNRFDLETETFSHYLYDPENPGSIGGPIVYSGLQDSKGRFWFTTRNGLNQYIPETDSFILYENNPDDPESLHNNFVWDIYEDSKENLWLSTRRGGLNQFFPESGKFKHFIPQVNDPYSISDDMVVKTLEDSAGNLWVATENGGLNYFDPVEEKFFAYRTLQGDQDSIISDTLQNIFEDRSGILWIASRRGGISKLYDSYQRFQNITQIPGVAKELNSSNVHAMQSDLNETLWVGTTEGGLNKINLKTRDSIYYEYDPEDESSISNNSMYDIYTSPGNNNLWIATVGGGLVNMNKETEKFTSYKYDPDDIETLSSNYLTAITPDKDGNLWVGTLGLGLDHFNIQTTEITKFKSDPENKISLSDNTIFALETDDDWGLWIGTNRGGVSHLNPESGHFTRYLHDPDNPNSIINNSVYSLFFDVKGFLWIGTANGLSKLEISTETFINYNLSDEIPNNTVYGVLMDKQGMIWISTGNGIAKMNPETEEIIHYSKDDGLQGNQFNLFASHIGLKGELYFGGTKGLNVIQPELFDINSSEITVAITNLELFNKSVQIGSELLPISINQLDHITLPHEQDIMTLIYKGLNYQINSKTQYQHRLLGFEENWSPASLDSNAIYTNLDHGDYTFQIRASNHDGVWGSITKELGITILPPWWKTLVFRIIVIIAFITVFILIIHFREKGIRKKNRILEKRVQERTQKYERAIDKLQESEKNLSITLNSIGDAVIATDHLGRITKMNPIAEELTGYSFSEAEGSPLIEIFHIRNSQSREIIQKPVNKVMGNGEIIGLESHTILISRDGTEIQISNNSSPIRNKEDDIIGIVLVFRDVTQQYIIEEQLRHSQKMDSIGELAGGMAHDFNNVLSGIMSASEILLLPQNGLNEQNLKYVNTILQASVRASDLISKLLAFGRKSKIVTTTLNIHEILDNTEDILKGTIDKKINISSTKDAHNFNMNGDQSAIESTFINLGINASHAMPDGGVIQIVTNNVFLDKEYCDSSSFEIIPGNYIQIEIQDTGCGISKKNLQKIFDPFFTTKDQGKGTGLGLSAVYGTIQDHHGLIEVQSDVGVGTTFSILLPCAEKSTEQVKEIIPTLTGAGTILIVDDEEMNRKLNTDILESLGYKVLTAEDGLESIDIFRNKHTEIDIVLMDMIMPKMNGTEAFYKMKEIDDKCKVIITSGYTQDENIEKLIKDGLAGFLNKPYKISEISQLLGDVSKK